MQEIEDDEFPWRFEIGDVPIENRCQICSKRKTIEYMFDGDALKFWDSEDYSGNFDEIDVNDFIDMDEVNCKVIKAMKEKYSKGTLFINIEDA